MKIRLRPLFLLGLALPAVAQWPQAKLLHAPRLASGELNIDAPAPKTAEGRADLSGIWKPVETRYSADLAADLKPGEVSFTAKGAELFRSNRESRGKDDPEASCMPTGMPRREALAEPLRIVQTPGLMLFLYQAGTTYRQVFLDGRALPADPLPNWDGYSVGHWDGDALVVETHGVNGRAWLDGAGHPVSEALRLTERFRRTAFGRMKVEMTVDDREIYTKPWTVGFELRLEDGTELQEEICLAR